LAPDSSSAPVGESERISVIIPTFNHAAYLGAAIESVLAQTAAPFEVIVIDDGSSDAAEAVALMFAGRVRYVRQERLGIGGARNRGVRETRGPLLAFIDADDYWPTDKLERQLEALRADPTIDVLFGHVREFHSDDLDDEERRRCPKRDGAIGAPVAGTMLIRRETFEKVGPFESQWRVGEFLEWSARAVDAGLRMLVLPRVLLHRRIHRSNTGRREASARLDYVRIVKQSMDRRRTAGRGPLVEADPAPEE
jgi:glycosyltransferase involved in cell wall biosynthesis